MTSKQHNNLEISRRSFIASSFRLGYSGLALYGADQLGMLKPTLRLGKTAAIGIFNLADSSDEAQEVAPPDEPVQIQNLAETTPIIIEQNDQDPSILGDGWYISPNYLEIIGQLDLEQWKKDFVVMAVESMAQIIREGALVNPRVGIAQTVLETGYGKHLAAKNNYYGQKAYGDEPSQMTDTLEDYGNGNEPIPQRFKEFEEPIDSFRQYGQKISELKHFDDAEACRYDDVTYITGVQNYADPATCAIILPQGYRDEQGQLLVSSYATDRGYTDKILNITDILDLDQIFTR